MAIGIEDAWRLVAAQSAAPAQPVSTDLQEAVGRRLASPVFATLDSPPFRKSLMDGFAIRLEDISDGVALPVADTVFAASGRLSDWPPGTALRVMTGAQVPASADAVVMREQASTAQTPDGERVTLLAPHIVRGQNILEQGQNLKAGSIALPAGHRIRAVDAGLIAECGQPELRVHRSPRFALIVTGDELVDWRTSPGPGQIRNTNGPLLRAMISQAGYQADDLGTVGDDPAELSRLVRDGLARDILLLTGGVSAGLADHVPGVLREAGVEQVFHGVSIKPGKPLWYGVHRKGGHDTHVFGLPGNPLSSLVGFELFVRLAAHRLAGGTRTEPPVLAGELAVPHQVRGPRTTWWPGRASVRERDGVISLWPVAWQGSSDLSSLSAADALLCFPPRDEPWPAGEVLRWLPLGPVASGDW